MAAHMSSQVTTAFHLIANADWSAVVLDITVLYFFDPANLPMETAVLHSVKVILTGPLRPERASAMPSFCFCSSFTFVTYSNRHKTLQTLGNLNLYRHHWCHYPLVMSTWSSAASQTRCMGVETHDSGFRSDGGTRLCICACTTTCVYMMILIARRRVAGAYMCCTLTAVPNRK